MSVSELWPRCIVYIRDSNRQRGKFVGMCRSLEVVYTLLQRGGSYDAPFAAYEVFGPPDKIKVVLSCPMIRRIKGATNATVLRGTGQTKKAGSHSEGRHH
jgi:hypothetical protein